jgi:MFS family permease
VSVAAIYVLAGVSAGALAFDSPARHSFVPRLVPARDLPGALTVMLTVFQFAAIGGPALAGLLLSQGGGNGDAPPAAGLSWVYGLNAVSFLGVIAALLTMRKDVGAVAARAVSVPPLASLKEGIRFVFRSPLIVWTMVLDFFATFFSGSMSLLPIFADRVLGVGAAGYGWLRAAPGLGATVASAALALRSVPRRQGRVFLAAVAAYGAATIVFGLSRAFAFTLFALMLVGLTDTVSTVIRQTVRSLATPDALRGRMTSVNMIFFQGGPQLGELQAGVVASLFASAALGATVAVVSGGLATIAIAAVVAWRAPFLRTYDIEDALRGEAAAASAP